jgi:molybdopterin synthase sulfur carrier subunit
MSEIRVVLPYHLRTLARSEREVQVQVNGAPTQKAVIDALEQRFPTLQGTIREHGSVTRRPLLRFFACGQDLSHEAPDSLLPEAVVSGKEPFMIIGAMAGG